MNFYNVDPYDFRRIITREVNVGDLGLGGLNPIRLQSMTNTSTLDVKTTVEQAERIIKAGSEMLRISTASMREVEAFAEIKAVLRQKGYNTPLIADTHFNADIAFKAAEVAEKVRINPGNFLGDRNECRTSSAYQEALRKTEKKLGSLIRICKKHNTAIRIGSNHGSLSARILYHYGNTPQGMVCSVMEFVKMCISHDFYDIILSLKSSDTKIMLHAYRLLMHEMIKDGRIFPLHLGVTEAGSGQEGRIRSAAGLGALLMDGLGDTIRVSLTEKPENEIPVAEYCRKLAPKTFGNSDAQQHALAYEPFYYQRRKTITNRIAGFEKPVEIFSGTPVDGKYITADKVYEGQQQAVGTAVYITEPEDIPEIAGIQQRNRLIVLLAKTLPAARTMLLQLDKAGVCDPVVLKIESNIADKEHFITESAAFAGGLVMDGLADAIWIEDQNFSTEFTTELSRTILQACGVRVYKAEFISCPGCGRTLFDLEETAGMVKKHLSHLKGLKIAVMGCIVNGPGEMADADYGYVGAGKGKVTLYRKSRVVKKNIPVNNALEELINIIKENDDWVPADSG
ncbi:MAG: (E)-4-hydroxy-3-methylbut-2-enyl-diphosphate synthase [Bacteroidales bacterium]